MRGGAPAVPAPVSSSPHPHVTSRSGEQADAGKRRSSRSGSAPAADGPRRGGRRRGRGRPRPRAVRPGDPRRGAADQPEHPGHRQGVHLQRHLHPREPVQRRRADRHLLDRPARRAGPVLRFRLRPHRRHAGRRHQRQGLRAAAAAEVRRRRRRDRDLRCPRGSRLGGPERGRERPDRGQGAAVRDRHRPHLDAGHRRPPAAPPGVRVRGRAARRHRERDVQRRARRW